MGTPLYRVVWEQSVDSPDRRNLRDIETHYQIAQVAQTANEIRDFQETQLGLQAAAAVQTHRDLAQLGFGLGMVTGGLAQVHNTLTGIGDTLAELADGQRAIEDAVWATHGLLDEWLTRISNQMLSQQKTMASIAEHLQRPLETQVLEMRRKADTAIRNGMAATGTEASDWYADAMGLLESAVANIVGNQDHVAWFQIGWLRWKDQGDLKAAEEAFGRALRLSKATSDVYCTESARHLAYMRYLQDDMPGALQAVADVAASGNNPQVLFDAARYSAVNGHEEEAVRLLQRSIRSQPPLIVSMLAEADFAPLGQSIGSLVHDLTLEARASATASLAQWRQVLFDAKAATDVVSHHPGGWQPGQPWPDEIGLPSIGELERVEAEIPAADYLRALQVADECRTERASLRSRTKNALEKAKTAATDQLNALQTRIDRQQQNVERGLDGYRHEAARRKEEAERLLDRVLSDADKVTKEESKLNLSSAAQAGCAVQVVCVIVAIALPPDVPEFLGWAVGIVALTGFALVPMLMSCYEAIRRSIADSNAASTRGDAESTYRSKVEAVQAELHRKITARLDEAHQELAPLREQATRLQSHLSDISRLLNKVRTTDMAPGDPAV